MKNTNDEVDRLYQQLGIKQYESKPRNTLNQGTLNRELNINYSNITVEKSNLSWSSSICKRQRKN